MPEPLTGSDDENDAVVHVIQSSYHYRDLDNRPACTDEIREEEGWFGSAESADARCAQLNAKNRDLYDVAMARAKREQDARIVSAEATNRENEILRAAGIAKRDVSVPQPFTPVRFEDWNPEHGHTTYEVVSIQRSEHDGISPAFETDATN